MNNESKKFLKQLISKLENRTATIGIVGLGYVGLPLMLRYVGAGFTVLGFDIDAEKVAKLNRGKSYIEHIPAHSSTVHRKGLR
jgi:UDP-N-acetyl-D-glucosamine dehydrogenase